jgi:peptidoglycan hydrolase-like protein with peptidoglycan-binding domain
VIRAGPAAALLCAALACGHPRRAAAPEAGGGEPARQGPAAPDQGEARGIPPAEGRPRLPASPKGLLAHGAVREIQAVLAERGELGTHRPGELDPATTAALRRFQEKEHLAATGMPDRETLQHLGIDPERAYGSPADAPR